MPHKQEFALPLRIRDLDYIEDGNDDLVAVIELEMSNEGVTAKQFIEAVNAHADLVAQNDTLRLERNAATFAAADLTRQRDALLAACERAAATLETVGNYPGTVADLRIAANLCEKETSNA